MNETNDAVPFQAEDICLPHAVFYLMEIGGYSNRYWGEADAVSNSGHTASMIVQPVNHDFKSTGRDLICCAISIFGSCWSSNTNNLLLLNR
jgi:hypothetical protein